MNQNENSSKQNNISVSNEGVESQKMIKKSSSIRFIDGMPSVLMAKKPNQSNNTNSKPSDTKSKDK